MSEVEVKVDNELLALRAKRAELEQAREARDERRERDREVEAERAKIRLEEAIAKAESEIGPVGSHLAIVDTDLGPILLRRPQPLKFRRFQDKADSKSEDVEALVRPCVVYPSAAEVDVILHDLPATLIRLGNAVAELAGYRAAEVTKK